MWHPVFIKPSFPRPHHVLMYPLPHLSEQQCSLKRHWYASHIKNTGTNTLNWKRKQSRKALMILLTFWRPFVSVVSLWPPLSCATGFDILIRLLHGPSPYFMLLFWKISKRDLWRPQSDHYEVAMSGTTSSSSALVRFSGIPEGRLDVL